MKFLKVKIPKVGDRLAYPPSWNSVKLDSCGYITDKSTGELFVVGYGDDAIVDQLLLEANVTVMTKAAAISYSNANEDKLLTVTDEAKIRYLELKTALGQTLTVDELAAVDPDDKTQKGFGRSEIMADRINALP